MAAIFKVGDKVRIKDDYDPKKSSYYSPHPSRKGWVHPGDEIKITGVDFHTVTYQYVRYGKIYYAIIEMAYIELVNSTNQKEDDTQVICICPTPQLMSAGCKCGAFQKEQSRIRA